ncbi:MAG: DUF736 family protein [Bacteroidales bacterium]
MSQFKATIGRLRVSANSQGVERLVGKVASLSFAFSIGLDPLGIEPGTDEPTHNVVLKGASGALVECGVAWEGKIRRGDNQGKRYYSISINALPELPDGLYMVAWPDDEAGEYYVQFSPKTGHSPRDSAQREASSPGHDMEDDEIPY